MLDSLDEALSGAARALNRHGLAHAYGHASIRIDDREMLVTPGKPLGLFGPGEPGIRMTIDSPLADGALGELRIHQKIYRLRGDVGAICRFQSPAVITLSTAQRTPRALHGLGTYFAPAPPLWEDPALVRDDARALSLAQQLADARAIVLRGNGAVTVGETIEQALAHAYFLEDAARIELAAMAAGLEPLPYTKEQVATRAVGTGGLYERMWAWLTHGDEPA